MREKIYNISDEVAPKEDPPKQPIVMRHGYDIDGIMKMWEIEPGESIMPPYSMADMFRNIYPSRYIKVEMVDETEVPKTPQVEYSNPVWADKEWSAPCAPELGGKITVPEGLSFWDDERYNLLILNIGGSRCKREKEAIEMAIANDGMPKNKKIAKMLREQWLIDEVEEIPDATELPEEEETIEEITEKEEIETKEVPTENIQPPTEAVKPEESFDIDEWCRRYRVLGADDELAEKLKKIADGRKIFTRDEFKELWGKAGNLPNNLSKEGENEENEE